MAGLFFFQTTAVLVDFKQSSKEVMEAFSVLWIVVTGALFVPITHCWSILGVAPLISTLFSGACFNLFGNK